MNYFRKLDFHRIFGTVLGAGRVFGGQYLYVVAGLDSVRNYLAEIRAMSENTFN